MQGRPYFCFSCAVRNSDWAYVFGLKAFGPYLHFELDLSALLKNPVPRHLNCGMVNKDVLPSLPLNKAVAFRGIEPLHDPSLSHGVTSPHSNLRPATLRLSASYYGEALELSQRGRGEQIP